jgi:hypothetical protein
MTGQWFYPVFTVVKSLSAKTKPDSCDISRNRFLYIFEISAPRGFGEAWAQGHLSELVPDMQKPSKKLDKNYSGEYDFILDGEIKIEVKASRAVDFDSDEPLVSSDLSCLAGLRKPVKLESSVRLQPD